MTMLASQITSLMVVYSIVYLGVNQRKHQSSASLAFVREIHRGPVNFPHKWPVTRKMFPLDDVIMSLPISRRHFHLNISRKAVIALPLGRGMAVFHQLEIWSNFTLKVVVLCAISCYIVPRYIKILQYWCFFLIWSIHFGEMSYSSVGHGLCGWLRSIQWLWNDYFGRCVTVILISVCVNNNTTEGILKANMYF